jgi:LPPG:FO 2-phospho-L-lactate transferase
VRRRCEPRVQAITSGARRRAPRPGCARGALESAALEAILLCPSNPYLSLDPLLAVAAAARPVRTARVPVVAVTPLVGGKAVKGPTAKIMHELGIPLTPRAIAQHYAAWIDGFVLDRADAAHADAFDIPVHVTDTLMQSHEDRERLAREVLGFAATLARA